MAVTLIKITGYFFGVPDKLPDLGPQFEVIARRDEFLSARAKAFPRIKFIVEQVKGGFRLSPWVKSPLSESKWNPEGWSINKALSISIA